MKFESFSSIIYIYINLNIIPERGSIKILFGVLALLFETSVKCNACFQH